MSVFISPAIVLNPSAYGEPLNHARIGYKTIVTRTNVSGTAAAAGFPVSAISNPATYERYKPVDLPATLTIDAGEPVECDYIGIAAHTLGSGGCSFTVEHSPDNINWTEVSAVTPVTDQSLMAIFEPATRRYWRLVVNGSAIPLIGVIYIGQSLQMQRAIYGGHSPLPLSRKTAVRPNVSETGQWLGASQERKGFKTSFSWKNLKAAWYRQYFDPFVAVNPRVIPFFIAWNPIQFPDEAGYCWATSDIQPKNSGTLDYMDVSLSVEGFNDRN